MRAQVWGAAAATLFVADATPAFAQRLTPNDIKATFFNGQEFTASTPSKVQYKMVYTADGKVTREPVAKTGRKGEGTWKLDQSGFCTTWKGSTPSCYIMLSSGANKWSVMKGSTTIAVWTK
jgi:hypothetical protein